MSRPSGIWYACTNVGLPRRRNPCRRRAWKRRRPRWRTPIERRFQGVVHLHECTTITIQCGNERNAPDRIRTYDLRFRKQPDEIVTHDGGDSCRDGAESAGRSAGNTPDPSTPPPAVAVVDAELAALVAAWPAMPPAIRRAAMALVGSVTAVAETETPAGDHANGGFGDGDAGDATAGTARAGEIEISDAGDAAGGGA